jgi:hypothetical protein
MRRKRTWLTILFVVFDSSAQHPGAKRSPGANHKKQPLANDARQRATAAIFWNGF